jgi:hypothetical protein
MPEYLCPHVEIIDTREGLELCCSVDICPFDFVDPPAFDKQCCITKYADCYRTSVKKVFKK